MTYYHVLTSPDLRRQLVRPPVIEHHLEVTRRADQMTDLCQEGGALIGAGTHKEFARNGTSFTGQLLRAVLAGMAAGVAVAEHEAAIGS